MQIFILNRSYKSQLYHLYAAKNINNTKNLVLFFLSFFCVDELRRRNDSEMIQEWKQEWGRQSSCCHDIFNPLTDAGLGVLCYSSLSALLQKPDFQIRKVVGKHSDGEGLKWVRSERYGRNSNTIFFLVGGGLIQSIFNLVIEIFFWCSFRPPALPTVS